MWNVNFLIIFGGIAVAFLCTFLCTKEFRRCYRCENDGNGTCFYGDPGYVNCFEEVGCYIVSVPFHFIEKGCLNKKGLKCLKIGAGVELEMGTCKRVSLDYKKMAACVGYEMSPKDHKEWQSLPNVICNCEGDLCNSISNFPATVFSVGNKGSWVHPNLFMMLGLIAIQIQINL